MPFGHFFTKNRRIYLDYAAATPVRKEVLDAMEPYFRKAFGNPSAIHKEGVAARTVIEDTRAAVAQLLHVRPDGVVFTGNGTESNNLALYGVVRHLVQEDDVALSDIEIISTKIEHPSIIRVLEHLETQGVVVRYVDVDSDGRIDEKHLQTLLSAKTRLLTFAYANSEIGVVQDVKRITRLVKKYNADTGARVLVHLDAAQAPLWLPLALDMLGVDLASLDAGKCYGPKGIGVLAMRHGVSLKAVQLGGGQEFGLRAGTENVPLIVGCGKALEIAAEGRESRSARASALRDSLIAGLQEKIPGVVLNGSREHRIANNVNISIPDIDSEFAIVTLDHAGIAASTKSACSGASGNGSRVVRVITNDDARAMATLRFTLGEETTSRDIARSIDVLSTHTEKMRAFHKTLT